MWPILIIGILTLIGVVLTSSSSVNREQKIFNLILTIISVLNLLAISLFLNYNIGKAIRLDSMPQKKVYTVTAVTAGFTIINDESKDSWSRLNEQISPKTWLIRTVQTNLTIGRKYMIIDNPNPMLDNKIDSKILIEVNF